MTVQLTDPAIAAFVAAINSGDKKAFFTALTENATMSDDGTDRDLDAWTEKEIFSANGHLDVESLSDDGLSLTAVYTNSTWGSMRTRWSFTVTDGKVSHFETGRA